MHSTTMRRAGRGRLMVVDEGRLVGMLSLKDALQDFRVRGDPG
jgi:CBS domain-containing protein